MSLPGGTLCKGSKGTTTVLYFFKKEEEEEELLVLLEITYCKKNKYAVVLQKTLKILSVSYQRGDKNHLGLSIQLSRSMVNYSFSPQNQTLYASSYFFVFLFSRLKHY